MSSPGRGSDAARPCSSVSWDVLCCSLASSHPRQRSCHWFCCTQFLQACRSTSHYFPTHVWAFSSMWGTCELWGHFRGVWIPWAILYLHGKLSICSCGAAQQGLGEFSSEECPLPTSHSRLSFFLLHVNFQDVKESLHLHRSKWEMYVKWGMRENYIFNRFAF